MKRNPRKQQPAKTNQTECVTWQNVKKRAEFIYIVLTKNGTVTPPLPFGQQPTATVDLKCDEFFQRLFQSDEISVDMPPDIAPWIMARLVTAMTMINTYEAHGAPAPKAKTIEDYLFDSTVAEWNKCMCIMWTVFAPGPDGKTPVLKVGNFGKGLDPNRFSGN